MDINELLRRKALSYDTFFDDTFVGGAEEELARQLALGDDADPEKVRQSVDLIGARLHPLRKEQMARQVGEGTAGSRMLAICDFAAVPYSFDILVFLVAANKARLAAGCDVLDVAFVAHASDPGIENETIQENIETRFRTLGHNLGIQATRLLENVGSVLYFDNRSLFLAYLGAVRDRVELFPSYYLPERPTFRRGRFIPDEFSFFHITDYPDPAEALCLTPPDDEVTFARRWIAKHAYPDIPVTVTIRDMKYAEGKNTDIAAWAEAIAKLAGEGIKFIVVPDYDKAYLEESIAGEHVVYCHEAVLSLPFRAALYREASFNTFGNNGPMALGYLSSDVNYVTISPVRDDTSAREADLLKVSALERGGQFWGANEFQRLVWEPETADVITSAVREMKADLDAAGRLIPGWYRDL